MRFVISLILLALAVVGAVKNVWVLMWVGLLLTAGIAFFTWALGGFQPCPKCTWSLTVQHHSETPDASYGNRYMHPRIEQQCYNPRCRKTTVLEGIVVS